MTKSNLNPCLNQAAGRVWILVLNVEMHNLVLEVRRQVHQHYSILPAFWIARGPEGQSLELQFTPVRL